MACSDSSTLDTDVPSARCKTVAAGELPIFARASANASCTSLTEMGLCASA